MILDICFCFPAGDAHYAQAYNFLSTYLLHPPMTEHRLVLLCDQANVTEAAELFSIVPGSVAIPTPDHARDLSRYQAYAHQSDAQCMLMLGGSTYCRKPGWGLRVITSFLRMGPRNLYGACGNTGGPGVHKHIRTTGWWTAPEVLRRYPWWPKDVAGRYEMEHGQTCISGWILNQGAQCWIVNFGSEYDLDHANDDVQGYARGSQQNLLLGDRLTQAPYQPFP